MAERISPVIKRLASDRKIIRSRISRNMVLKELKAAESDLEDGNESFEAGKFKWATIQGYYSNFHSPGRCCTAKGFERRATEDFCKPCENSFALNCLNLYLMTSKTP